MAEKFESWVRFLTKITLKQAKKPTKKTNSFHGKCRYHVLFRNHSWFQICTLFAWTPYLNDPTVIFSTIMRDCYHDCQFVTTLMAYMSMVTTADERKLNK